MYNIVMDLGNISLDKFKVKKTEDWKDICAELQKTYGRGVWYLITQPGVTNQKMIDADMICKKRGQTKFGYFRNVVLGLK
jgi:hypothetical protein